MTGPSLTEPTDHQAVVRTFMTLAGLYTLAASLIWGVNTLFLLDAGLAIGEVFIANALFSVGMVVFEIPTGVVADTLGRRASYLLSVAVLAATTGMYLIAAQAGAGLVWFGAISLLMGLGFTFFSGALEAWLVDALDATEGEPVALERIFARGAQVNGTAMFVGTISGGLLGQLDLAIPFVVRSVLLVAVFFLAWRAMHDIGFETVPLRPRDVPAAMREQARVGVAHGWNHRGLRLLTLSATMRAVFFGWAFYAAQPYLLELLQRDAVWVIGLVTAGVSLSTIVGGQIVAWLTRRCRRRSTILLGASAVSAVAAVTIGITDQFTVALCGLLLVAMAMGVVNPVRQAYLHEVTESSHRATVVSWDAMIASIGGAAGQAGLGAVADRQSISAGYVVGGSATALALPLLWLLRRRGGPEDHTSRR